MRCAWKILVRQMKGRDHLEDQGIHGRTPVILMFKMDLREMWWEDTGSRWGLLSAVVNTVMKFAVPQNGGRFFD
jgi:hypothetical protein